MSIDDYSRLDGLGLAALVATKQVQPIELVDEAIARIERHNPKLNAVIWTMFDRARAMAKGPLPQGRFAGVPFLLKDALGDIEGAPTRHGSAFVPATPYEQNARLTNRFLAAGLVPLGKTNVPELTLMPITESRLYGPARNPWDVARTPGGSSGGAAAAVAAGMVPVAHANDGGGSIRGPASCCGLVGLKPTRARTSVGPTLGEGWGSLEVEHVVSRSVRDSAAMLDATAGSEPGDPYCAPPPAASYLAELGNAPQALRIALVRSRPDGSAPHADCLAAVDLTAALCRSLGHHVDLIDPPAWWAASSEPFTVLYATSQVTFIDSIAAATGAVPSPNQLEAYTLAVYEMGKSFSAAQYQASLNAIHQFGRAAAALHRQYDVMLTPTMGAPPLPIGTVDTESPNLEVTIGQLLDFLPFTTMANMTGQPAITLPLFWSADNLPIGSQFIGRFGDESLLLRLAAQLEAAQPWAHRHPPVWN